MNASSTFEGSVFETAKNIKYLKVTILNRSIWEQCFKVYNFWLVLHLHDARMLFEVSL